MGYNVGGIVGQMALDITLQFSFNGLEELQTELNGLHNLIDATLDDAQSASDTVSGRITRISGYADAARDSAHNMTGQLGDFVDSNVDTANNILLLVERYLAKAAPIMEDLAAASDSTTQAIAALRQLLDTLDGMEEYNDQLLAQLQDTCRELAQGCDDLESGLTALENAFALMEGGVAKPDTQPVRDDIAALREAVLTLETTIGRALEEIGISGAVTPDTKAQLKAGLKTVLDCYDTTIRDLVDLLVHTNFSALREQNLETLRQILGYLRSAMGSFAGASGHFSSAMNALADAMGTLREINAQMGPVFDQLDEVLANAQQASTYLTSAFTRLAQWAQELSGENPGSFTGLGDGFGDSSDSLNTALTGISNELTALNGEMSSATPALLSRAGHQQPVHGGHRRLYPAGRRGGGGDHRRLQRQLLRVRHPGRCGSDQLRRQGGADHLRRPLPAGGYAPAVPQPDPPLPVRRKDCEVTNLYIRRVLQQRHLSRPAGAGGQLRPLGQPESDRSAFRYRRDGGLRALCHHPGLHPAAG